MHVYLGPYPKNDEDRAVDVVVHDYDIWNLDSTLATIAVPLLKKYREEANGYFLVDQEDLPEYMRISNRPSYWYGDNLELFPQDDYEVEWAQLEQWRWVVNEMIYALEAILNEDSLIATRQKHGLMLFGKYFQALWD
jgi:hypothetical protein